ncbi:hypothetical protein [Piscirickettsia litoralis]|uniref:Uncharacterized protein n=1 Tax=Piscirickettsia litoralis TaxID=1891921 RepID=A0ABX2ZYK6_9GAMM|nr:hypothetical protein [Piscirickettsia litoralis]ODN41280.1 hypothetical protein BGC07_17085 [Piscirickettsia litoralis]
MNPGELLVIGATSVRAIRRSVKYSENVPELYKNRATRYFWSDRRKNLDIAPTSFYSARARRVLDVKVGFCDELGCVTTYLAGMNLDQVGKIHMSGSTNFVD